MPAQLIGMMGVIMISTLTVMTAYVAIGSAGYVAFPGLVQGNVLNNFPDSDILVQVRHVATTPGAEANAAERGAQEGCWRRRAWALAGVGVCGRVPQRSCLPSWCAIKGPRVGPPVSLAAQAQ